MLLENTVPVSVLFMPTFLNSGNIWYLQDFAAAGYRTLYVEDTPVLATFDYLMPGFQVPPTDYYLRPFLLAFETNLGHGKVRSRRNSGQSVTCGFFFLLLTW